MCSVNCKALNPMFSMAKSNSLGDILGFPSTSSHHFYHVEVIESNCLINSVSNLMSVPILLISLLSRTRYCLINSLCLI